MPPLGPTTGHLAGRAPLTARPLSPRSSSLACSSLARGLELSSRTQVDPRKFVPGLMTLLLNEDLFRHRASGFSPSRPTKTNQRRLVFLGGVESLTIDVVSTLVPPELFIFDPGIRHELKRLTFSFSPDSCRVDHVSRPISLLIFGISFSAMRQIPPAS